jgi:hypothetical protein
MRGYRAIIASLAAVVLGGATMLGVTLAQGAAASTTLKPVDNALFDQTSGDHGAKCHSASFFEFRVAVRAIDGDAILRVHFQDGSFIDYPIPDNTSFSFTEAAGDTVRVDRTILVDSAPSSTGKLVGWVSANTINGNTNGVSCVTT